MPSTSKTIKNREIRRSSRLATIERTEDEIVIFKVRIEYSEENVTKRTVIEKLSSYGKIKDFSIIKRYGLTTCKITFYNAMSASNLLHDRYIKINNANIMIKPCPTWEQPFQVTSFNEKDLTPATFNQHQDTVDILTLNDYCLAMIFEYLDLNSQLRFSFCNERLEDIFINMICKRSIPQQLKIDELRSGKFSDWEIWQFFKTAGQCVKGIEVLSNKCVLSTTNTSKIDIKELIKEFGTNVERLQLIETNCLAVFSFSCYFNMSLLTEIELYACNLYDYELGLLVNCCNLTSLGLGKNTELYGATLPQFNKLQRLSLYGCTKIRSDNLIATCKNTKLKYLDIGCILYKTSHVTAVQYCPELETLKTNISCNNDCKLIMELQNLNSLELNHCYNSSISNLNLLFDKCYNNLKILKIFSYTEVLLPNIIGKFSSLRTLWLCVDDSGTMINTIKAIIVLKDLEELYIQVDFRFRRSHLLSVVKNCTKLKRFCIRCNKRLNENFIQSCYDILLERENEALSTSAALLKPLTIFVSETCITSHYIEDFNSSPKSKLLKIKKFSHRPFVGLLNNDLPFDVPYKSPLDPPPSVYSDSDNDEEYVDHNSSNRNSDDDDDDNNDNDLMYMVLFLAFNNNLL